MPAPTRAITKDFMVSGLCDLLEDNVVDVCLMSLSNRQCSKQYSRRGEGIELYIYAAEPTTSGPSCAVTTRLMLDTSSAKPESRHPASCR